MVGWVKLHRRLLDWGWYTVPNTFRLFMHLLLKANHEVSEWHGMILKPGQLITGRKILAKELNLTERQIRTSLTRLKTTGEITIKTTNRFSIITISNWGSYQVDTTRKRPAKRPASGHSNDHRQEYKEEKNNISVIFDEFRKQYPGTKRGLKTELDNFLRKNSPETVSLLLPALNREKEHKEKLQENNEFVPMWKNLSTWINQKCWEQEFQPAIGKAKKEFIPAKGLQR